MITFDNLDKTGSPGIRTPLALDFGASGGLRGSAPNGRLPPALMDRQASHSDGGSGMGRPTAEHGAGLDVDGHGADGKDRGRGSQDRESDGHGSDGKDRGDGLRQYASTGQNAP